MIDRAFWKGRRVLITGHTGFKGSWLALWLESLGAKVSGYALPPATQPNLFSAAAVGTRIRSGFGDVRDLESLRTAVSQSDAEIVFHFAAQALVGESYREPAETFATNVMGTVNCLEAMRARPGVAALVIATTDKCYENRSSGSVFTEADRLGGDDPYSGSKAAAEIATAAYRASFFVEPGATRVATVRAGNVLGGGDWAAERLVPDAVRAFVAAQPLSVRNPSFIRPWQHVLEPLCGYLALAQRLCSFSGAQFAEAWNFGPGSDSMRTVSWVADQLVARWPRAQWRVEGRDGGREASDLRLDSTKARTRLGWGPKLGLERALDWVVEWYRAHSGGADAARITLEQIERYERLVVA